MTRTWGTRLCLHALCSTWVGCFDLGPRYMLRLQGALIGLTSNSRVPCKCCVRLDLADSHAELQKACKTRAALRATSAHRRSSSFRTMVWMKKGNSTTDTIARLETQGGRRLLGRLLSGQVWSCSPSCSHAARKWRL